MKKYFQSIAYVVSVFAAMYGLHIAITTYEKPFDIYENPLVWIILIALILMVLLRELVNIVALERVEKLELEKEGIDPETVDRYAWFRKLLKKWTRSKAIEEEGEIVLDHNYDGIKELDNSLPPWWLYMFYITIIFGVIYMARYHMFGGDDQATEYQKEVAEATRLLEQRKQQNGGVVEVVVDANTATILTDEASLGRGKAVFNLNCASCHAQDGGGGIGPNLTDKYWILGGDMKSVFTTISDGGRTGKGMVAWKSNLKSKDIEKVASYILSLQGTTPKKPKDPQGELWEEE
ncbi:cbb3-type cytochrome c oxidase N-terminal domain-containing protein [Pseudotenacibaculum haliotis]|uniref:Cbb3-type cytochrome c oxidase N-terminal domain-containing protein n=1 Tax=Pseudotenacibaculum haliotis TaxID=1862138 RepID=A0ABW5LVU2_9FLAO